MTTAEAAVRHPTTTRARWRPSPTARGALLCTVSMLLLGASVSVTPVLVDYPVLMGQLWRYLVGGLALLVVARLLHARMPRPTFRELGWLLAVAAIGMAAFNVLLLLAVREAAPSVTASVVGCAPVVLALVSPALTRRRPGPWVVAGALVVAVGVAVGQGGGSTTPLGLTLSVAVMLCEVGFTVLATPVLSRLGAVAVATWASLLSVPLLLAGALVTRSVDLVVPTPAEGAALLWMALVMSALAFSLWYSGVTALGPARAGLFTGVLPLGAVAATAVLDPGTLGLPVVAGALIAGVGIVVGSRRTAGTPSADETGQREPSPSPGGPKTSDPTGGNISR